MWTGGQWKEAGLCPRTARGGGSGRKPPEHFVGAVETMPRWLRDRGGRPLKSGDPIIMQNGRSIRAPHTFQIATGPDGGRVGQDQVLDFMRSRFQMIPSGGPHVIREHYVPVQERPAAYRRQGYGVRHEPFLMVRSMAVRPDIQARTIQRAWRRHRERRRAGLRAAVASMNRPHRTRGLPALPAEVQSAILRRSSLMLPPDRERDELIGLAAAGYQRRTRRQKVCAKRVKKAPAKKRARRARR